MAATVDRAGGCSTATCSASAAARSPTAGTATPPSPCGSAAPNEPTSDAGGHRLRAGSTAAVEPMLLAGASAHRTRKDGWSTAAPDGRRAAHVEHTVAVTDDGPEVLTRP
jgi:hypothetical protein